MVTDEDSLEGADGYTGSPGLHQICREQQANKLRQVVQGHVSTYLQPPALNPKPGMFRVWGFGKQVSVGNESCSLPYCNAVMCVLQHSTADSITQGRFGPFSGDCGSVMLMSSTPWFVRVLAATSEIAPKQCGRILSSAWGLGFRVAAVAYTNGTKSLAIKRALSINRLGSP